MNQTNSKSTKPFEFLQPMIDELWLNLDADKPWKNKDSAFFKRNAKTQYGKQFVDQYYPEFKGDAVQLLRELELLSSNFEKDGPKLFEVISAEFMAELRNHISQKDDIFKELCNFNNVDLKNAVESFTKWDK